MTMEVEKIAQSNQISAEDIEEATKLLMRKQWRIEQKNGTQWVRDLVGQCKTAGVACFVKQLDIGGQVVKELEQFPEDLRIREMPSR